MRSDGPPRFQGCRIAHSLARPRNQTYEDGARRRKLLGVRGHAQARRLGCVHVGCRVSARVPTLDRGLGNLRLRPHPMRSTVNRGSIPALAYVPRVVATAVTTQGAWERLNARRRHGGRSAIYAFGESEKVTIGRRSREWRAGGLADVECMLEMARCLRELGQGRAPK
jgi:hypothetical protein